MFELLLLAIAQVQTIRLPPPGPSEVLTVKTRPDLVVKEIRIQNDRKMHVLVANTGTAAVSEPFAVRGSVEIEGASYDLQPTYIAPIPAGGEAWAELTALGLPMTRAASATAGADLLPEPKSRGSFAWWPNPMAGYDSAMRAAFPGMKEPCKAVTGCIAELDESNNNYAVAGVPRGTPDRLMAPELAPESLPERG